MKFTEDLQRLLPFGYLYLVIIGIIKESVSYYQIGINILKHSNIMDILISPIADLTSHPIVLIGFMAYLFFLYAGFYLVLKNYKKEWAKKLIGAKKTLTELTEDETKKYFGNKFISVLAVSMLSFFLGIGMANGKKISDNINNDSLKYRHRIIYNTGEMKDIYLIGSNSSNYFYVEKGNKNVKISPIGAIKVLEVINKKDLK